MTHSRLPWDSVWSPDVILHNPAGSSIILDDVLIDEDKISHILNIDDSKETQHSSIFLMLFLTKNTEEGRRMLESNILHR